MSQVADYFLCHGNSVYLASLDASKAFDRVNHVKLFNTVIGRGLPGNIVKILINRYGKASNIVKWNNCISMCVIVKSGIHQGGILSPLLLNIYIDSFFRFEVFWSWVLYARFVCRMHSIMLMTCCYYLVL